MSGIVNAPQQKFLALLAKEYPTVAAASSEIINLQAILKLPKPTEHFMSDLHGEYAAFNHILNSASGVVKEKVDRVLSDVMTADERAEFATLIYYPQQKLTELKPRQKDLGAWYRITLYRLIDVCRLASSKYTRSFVRKRLPKDFAYILDELLHAHFEDHDKDLYYDRILASILDVGRADDFIIALAGLIKRIAVFKLHIAGDIFDRGSRPDIILDSLMEHHSVDIQWGNHDVEWMGAASGSEVCIASVINVTLGYNNLETLEDGYGINLRPLALFAEEVYANADITAFWPKLAEEGDYTTTDLARVARMHKAIAIMLFKLECAAICRNPEFQMEYRALLGQIDFTAQSVKINGIEYRMSDCDFPTVNPHAPAVLTEGERTVLAQLTLSFRESERLQRHVRFLYAHGSVYHVENGNLLFHGAVPLSKTGAFREIDYAGKTYKGRAWMDCCERLARQGYFSPEGSDARRRGQDFLWYLWCGNGSPIYGRDKMATFEHFFIKEDAAWEEQKDPYYTLIESEDTNVAMATAARILTEFGLDPDSGHIINGHIPVRAAAGELPVKAGGRLIVIDGGFCKAYHPRTGIAGYTLVSSSRGLSLRSHSPFESTEDAISQNRDILSTSDMFEPNKKRVYVEDTDEGARLQGQINDLECLLSAYVEGTLTESV